MRQGFPQTRTCIISISGADALVRGRPPGLAPWPARNTFLQRKNPRKPALLDLSQTARLCNT